MSPGLGKERIGDCVRGKRLWYGNDLDMRMTTLRTQTPNFERNRLSPMSIVECLQSGFIPNLN